MSIRLTAEPTFFLLRHWSLVEAMTHTPMLATRLHLWSEPGRKRLNKLLAKMGISLQEAGKGYQHLDVEVKRTLGQRVRRWAESYGLDGLVPENGREGFVKCCGWRGTLSATDVVAIVSAILEVGPVAHDVLGGGWSAELGRRDIGSHQGYNARAGLPSPPHSSDSGIDEHAQGQGSDVPLCSLHPGRSGCFGPFQDL